MLRLLQKQMLIGVNKYLIICHIGQLGQVAKMIRIILGNMSIYQQDQGVKVHVQNPAGASVSVQSAMLGAGQGNYA
jgi:hypothetical protein